MFSPPTKQTPAIFVSPASKTVVAREPNLRTYRPYMYTMASGGCCGKLQFRPERFASATGNHSSVLLPSTEGFLCAVCNIVQTRSESVACGLWGSPPNLDLVLCWMAWWLRETRRARLHHSRLCWYSWNLHGPLLICCLGMPQDASALLGLSDVQ